MISDHAEVRGHSSFPPALLPAGSPGVGVGGDPGQRWRLQVRTYRLWCPVGRIQYRCKILITQLYWLTVNPGPLLNFLCGILLQVPVPRFAVGIVIGRNGEMIKKIQNDAGVRIQFKAGLFDGR